jgi:acyl dehydratase
MTAAALPARPATLSDLKALVGRELGPTAWLTVDQQRVDEFARVTEDLQWIHIDAARARESELGGTIAHGLLTLSLGPRFTDELISFAAFSKTLNYGYEKVRFPAPLPVGARVRMVATVASVEPASGGAQVAIEQRLECEGGERPVCVATAVARVLEAG